MAHLRRLTAPLLVYDRATGDTHEATPAELAQRGLIPVDESGLVVDCCRRRDTAAAPGVVLAGDLLRGGVRVSRYDRLAPSVRVTQRATFAGEDAP